MEEVASTAARYEVRTPTGGIAFVDEHRSVQLVNQYCQTFKTDFFSSHQPQFLYDDETGRCTIRMPNQVPEKVAASPFFV